MMASCFNQILLFWGIIVGSCKAELTVTENPTVDIPGLGRVFGERVHYMRDEYPSVNKYIDVFRGIPFAEPPVNQYRFAKPAPAAPFTEAYNATYFRSPCPQLGSENINVGEEDCLHLNIWVPSPRVYTAAVMVWIHGGAFLIGDGIGISDDGVPLVAFNDVVYVSIQYRLNSFGFLATGDSELPGNYGLWDQRLALKWVKDHIAAFDGNPDNIMIFGVSAGASSVGFHLLSPHSWDYFNTAALQSGTGTAPWAIEYDIEKARSDAIKVGERCKCDTSSSAALMGCLRERSMQNITAATTSLVVTTITNIVPFVPVVDRDFLLDDPRNLIKSGQFKRCNLLLGTTKDEGTLFASRAFPDQIPRRHPFIPRSRWESVINEYVYSYRNDLILHGVEQQYVDWKEADDPEANYFWYFVEMNTDEAFACPTDTYARAWSNCGRDVYLYQFNHIPSNQDGLPKWQGVSHGSEMQFVFGVALNELSDLKQTPEEINMTMYMMMAWTNFAKTGDPNRNDFEQNIETLWQAFRIPNIFYKELSPSMLNKKALKADVCHFWNNFVPKMVTFSADLAEEERQWREEFYSWKYDDMPEWRYAFDEYQNIKSSYFKPSYL